MQFAIWQPHPPLLWSHCERAFSTTVASPCSRETRRATSSESTPLSPRKLLQVLPLESVLGRPLPGWQATAVLEFHSWQTPHRSHRTEHGKFRCSTMPLDLKIAVRKPSQNSHNWSRKSAVLRKKTEKLVLPCRKAWADGADGGHGISCHTCILTVVAH